MFVSLNSGLMTAVSARRIDYSNPQDAEALVALLDHYAQDPMGGGEALPIETKANLIPLLQNTPHGFSIIAEIKGRPVGLANCFWGVSTFAAQTLVNIHDIIVHITARGQGVGKALFAKIEEEARAGGACKITLEVLTGNEPAKALYASLGYGSYTLDPETGTAVFWQKKLT
jgi:GNAT superfamily N-acetyltransferase